MQVAVEVTGTIGKASGRTSKQLASIDTLN